MHTPYTFLPEERQRWAHENVGLFNRLVGLSWTPRTAKYFFLAVLFTVIGAGVDGTFTLVSANMNRNAAQWGMPETGPKTDGTKKQYLLVSISNY